MTLTGWKHEVKALPAGRQASTPQRIYFANELYFVTFVGAHFNPIWGWMGFLLKHIFWCWR